MARKIAPKSSQRAVRKSLIANPVPWPNGARCAVAITFDIDTDSFLHLEQGEQAPKMLSALSWLRYDEVAVPRILEVYRRYGLKQTFFLSGLVHGALSAVGRTDPEARS